MLGQPAQVHRHGEAEVTHLGGAVARQEDVGGLDVTVDQPGLVDEMQTLCGTFRDFEDAFDGEAVRGFFEQGGGVAAVHVLLDHVHVALVLADVVDGDDVGVGAESGHGLGLALDALAVHRVQAFAADDGEGDLAIEAFIVGQEDAFAPALAEEPFDAVATGDEGRGMGWSWSRAARFHAASIPAARYSTRRPSCCFDHREEAERILVC